MHVLVQNSRDYLCHDAWSGRYFMSTQEKIVQAASTLETRRQCDGDVNLNDFYNLIDLDMILAGVLGWTVEDRAIEVRVEGIVTSEGPAAVSFYFVNPPRSLDQSLR